MKKLRNFFNKLFSGNPDLPDNKIFGNPYMDAQQFMYSYITFSGDTRKQEGSNKPIKGKVINFNDYKLRQA